MNIAHKKFQNIPSLGYSYVKFNVDFMSVLFFPSCVRFFTIDK